MANCYHCAAYIPNGQGYRRKVLVSQSGRVYLTRRGGGSYGGSYSLRTLCATCAADNDRRNKSLAWRLPLSVALGLVGSIAAIRFAMNNDIQTAPGSLAFLFFLVGGLGLLSFLLLGFITKETTQQAVVETQGAHYARGRLQQENTDNFVEEIESGTQPSVEGDTEAERIGLAILRKMNSAHSYFKPDDIEGLSALVMSHAADLGRDEAREFVSLLGRQKNEDIESWFGRALKLAPYQLSTEDATPWLTAVYRLAILLEVDIWFGLNEVEEKEIVRKILAEIDDKYQSLG